MKPAKIHLAGKGLPVEETPSHPAGFLYSGGYDADLNEVFAASEMGHPGGMAEAGGNPSAPHVSGLRIVVRSNGDTFWADDSMSLRRGLNAEEVAAIQLGLEIHFPEQSINHIARLEDIPR